MVGRLRTVSYRQGQSKAGKGMADKNRVAQDGAVQYSQQLHK